MMRIPAVKPLLLLACIFLILLSASLPAGAAGDIPGLVDISRLDPAIRLDIRYATNNNFSGRVVYPSPRCLVRADVAEKLVRVQQKLKESGYGLKIYDGYRPLAVQKKFWSIMPVEDYVADPFKGSRHNRGAAVDVTLVDSEGREMPMPSGYDDFTEKARRDYAGATEEELHNRAVLEEAMKGEGFLPFPTEWWHFDAPGWEKYPVSDQPLWAWSDNTLKILGETGRGTELAGFFTAQDYGLYGDVRCLFTVEEDRDKIIAAVLSGEADLALVSGGTPAGGGGGTQDLALLATLSPGGAGQPEIMIMARKDRLEADRDRLRSFVRSTLAGTDLAGRYPDAAAMAVLRRNQEMPFEVCRQSVIDLVEKYKIRAEEDPAPEAPPALPVRHLYPVTVAAGGDLLPLAGELTAGADRVCDSKAVVVKTWGSETSARLVGLGLCEFGLATADVVAEMEAGTGRFAGNPHAVRLVTPLYTGTAGPPVLLIASMEVPEPWIEGFKEMADQGVNSRLLDGIVAKMTLEEKVGQMIMASFRKWQDRDVTGINSEIARIVKDLHLGGVILFRENIVNPDQTVKLTDQLQRAAGDIPLFIATDQEGGRVVRLQTGTIMPGNMALGAARSPELAREVARAMGEELDSLGINVDLAPVLDVNVNPDNPVIGIRSFGEDPQLVADLGAAFIKGLHEAGVAATAKHFPGHGDTDIDSHLGLPSVPHDPARLKAVELKPFQQAFDRKVDMVMTAHVTFPAIDNTRAVSRLDGKEISVPATLSHRVLTGLIREEMGYGGVIITDALEMKAIADHFGPLEAVTGAVKAGADIVLMPAGLDQAYSGLLAAVRSGEIPESRIDESVKRLIRLKLSLGIVNISGGKLVPGDRVKKDPEAAAKIAGSVVGGAAHREIEKRAAEKAVTLLKNEGGILPFRLENGKKVVIFAPWDDRLSLMTGELERIAAGKGLRGIDVKGFVYEEISSITEQQRQAVDEADYVVLGSYSYDAASRTPGKHWAPDFALSVARYALRSGKPLAVMAVRNPYDIMYMPGVKAYIAVYGAAEGPNIPAGIDVIFGQARPRGRLPVSIPDGSGEGTLYRAGAGLGFDSVGGGD
ncbi:MAG: glycoside hydrolase family 3 C-terminal domain-containing protein [Peptococcaceae bacterium]|nr:glycoside hydrolase family 3 C-terminal domain-containing protein [Peptococcaceae bacterium]